MDFTPAQEVQPASGAADPVLHLNHTLSGRVGTNRQTVRTVDNPLQHI